MRKLESFGSRFKSEWAHHFQNRFLCRFLAKSAGKIEGDSGTHYRTAFLLMGGPVFPEETQFVKGWCVRTRDSKLPCKLWDQRRIPKCAGRHCPIAGRNTRLFPSMSLELCGLNQV